MTGTRAEQYLLGAVIMAPAQYRAVDTLVAPGDFTDGRMGDVWAGIGQMIIRGEHVDQITVEERLAEWGVRGLTPGITFDWASADVRPYAAPEYARAVRADAVRRGLLLVSQAVADKVREGASPIDVAAWAASETAALVDGASSGLLQTKTLAEVLEGVDSYDWVIEGLLERRDRLVITGAEGAGKTTFVRQLAVLAAAGVHPLSFAPIDPVNVLVVDAENTERQWRRAVRYTVNAAAREGRRNPAPVINIVAGKRIDITRGSHLGEIHRLIDRHKPDILFIGPLYKLVPKAINSDDDAAPLIVGLDSLRERDVALVMEAHAGHATTFGGERDLRPRGSSALLGWPEFGFGLRPMAEDPDVVAISRWRGDRDQRDWPRHLRRGNRDAGDPWPWYPSRLED